MMGPREDVYLEVEVQAQGGEPFFARLGLVRAEVSPRSGWRGMISGTAIEDPVERIRALPLVAAWLVTRHTARAPIGFRVTTPEGTFLAPFYVDSIFADLEEAKAAGRVAFEFTLSSAGQAVATEGVAP